MGIASGSFFEVAITLLKVVAFIFSIVDVKNPAVFALKVTTFRT